MGVDGQRHTQEMKWTNGPNKRPRSVAMTKGWTAMGQAIELKLQDKPQYVNMRSIVGVLSLISTSLFLAPYTPNQPF